VARARSDEIVNGVWTIPATRAKNSFEHSIALGPWGRSLMQTNHEWVFQAIKIDGPRNNSVWYKARDRVLARMEKLAGHPIERFTPHDFRRTARSNTNASRSISRPPRRCSTMSRRAWKGPMTFMKWKTKNGSGS
jgi:integrase